MPRIAYVNGAYVPHSRASVQLEDRGFQFADGVYEIINTYRGRLIDEVPHLERLRRSLAELAIARPMAQASMRVVMREMVRRNRLTTGLLYIQVTRGVAPRNHKFPEVSRPSLVMTARPIPDFSQEMRDDGVKVLTIADIRWGRCDIKSTALLPNILGKQQAAEAGSYEAWMVDEGGHITEGTSSNAWIITAENILVTQPTGPKVLAGITRQSILKLADELGYAVEERPFTVEEAYKAKEAFLSNSSHFVTPVTQVDDAVIANGNPGSLTMALHERYIRFMEETVPLGTSVL